MSDKKAVDEELYGKAEDETPEENPAEKKVEEKAEEKPAEKKAEEKPAEKKAEEKPAEKPVVEKYDIKLPEGSKLDDGAIERTVSFAKERGLTTKVAQELLDRESKMLGSYAESQHKAFKDIAAGWIDQAKADKEFGGEAFPANVELAKRVVTRYGSDELKKGLEETGFGNHPDLVRMLVRIGKSMSEDQLVMPGKNTTADKRDMAEVFYGQTKT